MIQWFKQRTIVVGLFSLLVLSACGSETSLESPAAAASSSGSSGWEIPAVDTLSESAKNGQLLYNSGDMLCASCHGASLQGSLAAGIDPTKDQYIEDGKVHNLADYIEAYMPPGKGSSSCGANCARDIAAYISAFTPSSNPPAPVIPTPVDPVPVDPVPVDPAPVNPTPVDPVPDEDVSDSIQRGKNLYARQSLGCAQCHGVEGVGSDFYDGIDPEKESYQYSKDPAGRNYDLATYLELWMPLGDSTSLCSVYPLLGR